MKMILCVLSVWVIIPIIREKLFLYNKFNENNSGQEDLNELLYESSNVTLKDLCLSLLVTKY